MKNNLIIRTYRREEDGEVLINVQIGYSVFTTAESTEPMIACAGKDGRDWFFPVNAKYWNNEYFVVETL